MDEWEVHPGSRGVGIGSWQVHFVNTWLPCREDAGIPLQLRCIHTHSPETRRQSRNPLLSSQTPACPATTAPGFLTHSDNLRHDLWHHELCVMYPWAPPSCLSPCPVSLPVARADPPHGMSSVPDQYSASSSPSLPCSCCAELTPWPRPGSRVPPPGTLPRLA